MKLIKQQEDMNIVPHEAMTVIARHNFGTPKDEIQVIKPMYKAYTANVTAYVCYELVGLDGTWDKMETHLGDSMTTSYLNFRKVTADTVEIWANGIKIIGRSPQANSGWFLGHGPRKLIIHAPSLVTGSYAFMTTYTGAKTIEEIEFPDTDKLTSAVNMFALPGSRLYHVRFKSLKNLTAAASMFWYAKLDKPTVLHIRDLLMEKEGMVTSMRLDIAEGYRVDIEVQAALDDIRTKVTTLTVNYSVVPDDLKEKVYREPIITA